MKNKIIMILSLLVVTNFNSFAYDASENWFDKIAKIKVGVSTKQEVERLFDSPVVEHINKFTWNENVYYKTKEGSLRVSYSLGNCSEGSDKYDLEKATVLSLFFHSFKPIKISKLKLNLKQFESKKEDDTENTYYSNNDLGIIYILFKDKIFEADISLTKIQIQHFKCKS